MWILYQLGLALALLVAGPVLLLRRGSHYLPTLLPRLGFYDEADGRGGLWIHAVSVGEVGVAATLVPHLPRELEIVVTTVTPTGQARARRSLRQRATVSYLPFDLGFAVRRFFRRFEPRALVLVEGDYWPLTLRHAHRHGLPVVVINGRVSDTTFRRLSRLRSWLRPMFGPVDRFGVQSAEDRHRLTALGIPPEKVVTTGNLKYETPEPPPKPELESQLCTLAAGRHLLVAGSTMGGEEEQVVDAFSELGEGALLVLAPRHPERWDQVEALLRRRGLAMVRRSRLVPQGKVDVVLLDSLGELASLYRIAFAAFIGGTLVPTGGHNPLEAARYAVPVAAGPSMENFREMAYQLDDAGAWSRVRNAQELAAVWRSWLEDPASAQELGQKARHLVEQNRGALERTLQLLAPLMDACGASRRRPRPS